MGKSSVDRLAELENQLTREENYATNYGAKEAFDSLYRRYGLPGIEALYAAGYDDPEKVWDFYQACHKSVGNMADKLKLV